MYNITVKNTLALFLALLIGLPLAILFSQYFPNLQAIQAIVAAGDKYQGPSFLPFHLATIFCLILAFVLRFIKNKVFLQMLGIVLAVVGQYFLFLVLFPMRELYGSSVYSFNILVAVIFYALGQSLLNRILCSLLAIGYTLVLIHQLWNLLAEMIPLLAWANIGLWIFALWFPNSRLQPWSLPIAWALTGILSLTIIIMKFIDPSGLLLGQLMITGGQVILLLTGLALPIVSFVMCSQKLNIPMNTYIWAACLMPISILNLLYFMNLHVALAFSWVIIGFGLRDRILLIFGLISMVIFQIFFYIQLPLTLFDKGVILVLSGMILITMQQLIYHVLPNFARPYPEEEPEKEVSTTEPTVSEQLAALMNNPFLFRKSAQKKAEEEAAAEATTTTVSESTPSTEENNTTPPPNSNPTNPQ